MKEAREVWIEFKLTDGRKVVAKFGLLGFSEELKECDDLVIQKDNSN